MHNIGSSTKNKICLSIRKEVFVTRKNIRGGIRVCVMMWLMCMCKVNECVKMSMCEHMHNYVHVTRM